MRQPPSRPDLRFAASLVALLAAQPVQAQVFVSGPPTASPAPLSAAPTLRPIMPDLAPVAPAIPAETLRFLPTTLEGLKLTGETGDLRWPVYLTAAQAAAPVKLRIGYVSAVSILPETSRLEVKVNDQVVGVDAIDAATGLRIAEFAVPASLLKPGYNAIALSVNQHHRVDCSVAATYELWTTLDPKETGLVLAGATRTITEVADLPALLPRADGSMPIHIVLTGKTNPAHVQRLIRATQQIAMNGRFLQPSVDFEPGDPDAYGLDLAIGTRAALGVLPKLVGALGVSGAVARFVPGETRRPFLVITGSTDAEVDQAIALLATATPVTGTPSGLLAADSYPATKVSGGESLQLEQLGLHSSVFAGRLLRRSFNLTLPADFLASDYGRGTFDLVGGYAPGLARGAQVRLDVNGRSSGVIKMPSAKGDTFNHNQLFLPLSLMHPGLNRIDMFAETPRAEDATCAASNDKRFVFLDKTELTLPTLARVERLPDLAGLTNGGLPYTRGAARLVVPKPDRETMAAALSLTARAAVSAGTLVPFTFATKVAATTTGSTLVVSPAQAMDPVLLGNAGLDAAKIEAAWKDFVPPPKEAEAGLQSRWWLASTDGPAACRLPGHDDPLATSKGKIPVSKRTGSGAESDDILDRWSGTERPSDSWRDRLIAAADTVTSWVDRADIFKARETDRIARDTSMILAQSVDPGRGNSVTTIVTAPDATTLRASVACLFDPQVWSKVHGRLASIDASNGSVAAVDSTSLRYVSSGSSSLSNSRLVLAGWFSLNPIAFIGMALLTALCLSGTTLWFVRGVGRRPE